MVNFFVNMLNGGASPLVLLKYGYCLNYRCCGVSKGDGGNPDVVLFCLCQCVLVSKWSEVVELKFDFV